MKRLIRSVLFAVLLFAPTTNFAPLAAAKAVPASAQQNRSKRTKKARTKNSKTKNKLAKTKSHPMQRRQKKQRSRPA